jgi:hypothetical protein
MVFNQRPIESGNPQKELIEKCFGNIDLNDGIYAPREFFDCTRPPNQ